MALPGTPDWLAERRQFVGASELAAIIGRDPYRSEFELALAKKGLATESPSTWPQRFGNLIQRTGLAVYSEVTGRRVRNITSTTANKRWPHVRASLDGRVVREPIGVEVKWTSRSIHEPYESWRLQVQGQMGIVGLDAVDIIRLSGRDEPAIWTVERDDALITDLLDMAEAWFVRYCLGDELPPVDGSRGASRYLDSQVGPPDMVASEEQVAYVMSLRSVRMERDTADELDRRLVNLLKASMAGAEALRGDGFRITWKPTKERTTTDWKAVAMAYRDQMLDFQKALVGEDVSLAERQLDEVVLLNTTTGEGTRPFRVNFEQGEGS
jgi:predicted phage-related endonuclease